MDSHIAGTRKSDWIRLGHCAERKGTGQYVAASRTKLEYAAEPEPRSALPANRLGRYTGRNLHANPLRVNAATCRALSGRPGAVPCAVITALNRNPTSIRP
jgi:hypothetical protein